MNKSIKRTERNSLKFTCDMSGLNCCNATRRRSADTHFQPQRTLLHRSSFGVRRVDASPCPRNLVMRSACPTDFSSISVVRLHAHIYADMDALLWEGSPMYDMVPDQHTACDDGMRLGLRNPRSERQAKSWVWVSICGHCLVI